VRSAESSLTAELRAVIPEISVTSGPLPAKLPRQ
jgi:hypothetical protein